MLATFPPRKKTFPLWLGALIVLACFAFSGIPARAAEIISQTANDSNNSIGSIGTANSLSGWQHGSTTDLFSATWNVGKFTSSTDVVTSYSMLIHNSGASTCTASTSVHGSFYYCAIGTDCSAGNRTFGGTTSCDNINVAPGADQWVECATPAVAANRVWGIGSISFSGDSNCDSTYQRFNSASVIANTNWDYNAASPNTGQDAAFRICTASTDCGAPLDPRPDPVTTIVAPTATAYGISGVPYRFASNVCADDYATEAPYVRWQIQKDDGGWTDFSSGSSEHFDFYVANGCTTGLAYGWGGVPNPLLSAPFTTGDYRIRASSFFTGDISDEDDWGAWTSYVEFSYESSAYGGGGGGSWGGGDADSGDGSAEDWASFFDGVDSHDDLYGACKLIGLDFNFLGTGESEAGTGDGLPCLWTWVRYALIPPADATFNFVKRPFDALITRWPLTYITSPWQALTGALTEGGECPFPDFFEGSSGMFGALPTVEPCTWLDPVATLIDDNAFVSSALVMFLWCAVVALLIDDAFKFFEA